MFKSDTRVYPGAVLKHYKGNRYVVLTVGKYHEDEEQSRVHYLSLGTGEIWERELSQFTDLVNKDTAVPRFENVGEAQVSVAGGEYFVSLQY